MNRLWLGPFAVVLGSSCSPAPLQGTLTSGAAAGQTSTPPGSPGAGGGAPNGAGGQAPAAGGVAGAGMSAGGQNAAGQSAGGSPTGSGAGAPPTGISGMGGMGGSLGTMGGTTGDVGGAAPVGGTAGAATGGASTTGGTGGMGVAGGATVEPCPSDAAFCSGFDSSELPEGAVFKLNGDPATPWTAFFEIDSSVKYAGASSLRVKKNSEPNASTQYKMLAVPSGGAAFWVRLYLMSDIELGQEGHNAYAAASVNDEPNDASRVEFADDVGLSFNASDTVRWPEGYGRLTSGGTNPYTLPANEWHCIELHFDGPGQVQELYVEGEQLISATGYPGSAFTFGVFKFGYFGFHNEADRGLWYDEVATGPTRIGCLEP